MLPRNVTTSRSLFDDFGLRDFVVFVGSVCDKKVVFMMGVVRVTFVGRYICQQGKFQ